MFTLDFHINTVCLPQADFVPYQTDCLASGWGKYAFGASEKTSIIQQKVPLSIVEFNQCEQELRTTRLGKGYRLDKSVICAGGVLGVDTCQVNSHT